MHQVTAGWYGFYKSTVDPNNILPTLNHLVVVNKAGWNATFPPHEVNDNHLLFGPGATVLTYLMWAETVTPSVHDFANLARVLVRNCLQSTNTFAMYVPLSILSQNTLAHNTSHRRHATSQNRSMSCTTILLIAFRTTQNHATCASCQKISFQALMPNVSFSHHRIPYHSMHFHLAAPSHSLSHDPIHSTYVTFPGTTTCRAATRPLAVNGIMWVQ